MDHMSAGLSVIKNDYDEYPEDFIRDYIRGDALTEDGDDIEFHDNPQPPSGAEGMATLVMPEWAYDVIMQTLYMDLNSKMIDDEIKFELSRAMDQIRRV